jgi:hypothetical protein
MDNEKSRHEPEGSSVLQYVKATTAASERARTVIIVMVVASVVVFTQIRNDDGWLDRRINVRTHALRLLDSTFDQKKEIDAQKPEDRKGERDWYIRAEYFVAARKYKAGSAEDRQRLQNEIDGLIKLRAENMRVVHLPFFGAVYDANDTLIFAGITFTVVLLWLTLSLNRERRNIQITFHEAEALGKSRLCYDLLVMQQVLTIPPASQGVVWKSISYVSKALYVMPLVFYSWQLHNDWQERGDAGHPLGWDMMHHVLAAGGFFFVLILCLTVVCLATSFRLREDWVRYAEQSKP